MSILKNVEIVVFLTYIHNTYHIISYYFLAEMYRKQVQQHYFAASAAAAATEPSFLVPRQNANKAYQYLRTDQYWYQHLYVCTYQQVPAAGTY